MVDVSPRQFFTEAINSANANVQTARKVHGKPSPEFLLKVAAIQADMAKAAGMSMIAEALYACSTPGQSIRFGMAEVAEALKSLRDA